MLSLWLLTNLLLALSLWILLGLEREQTYARVKKVTFAGIRTFALLSLLGFLAAMIGQQIDSFWLLGVALLVVAAFVILAAYVTQKANKTFGITTEVAALICLLIGILVALDHQYIAIATTIATFALMSLSEQLHAFVNKVRADEVYDAVKFAIIALIILPLLPNQDYGFLWIFNPYKIWLMVVFVSGIGFIWYVLTRVIWTKKWIWLTWLIWWIVSSTAVTTSLSGLSKKAWHISPFVFGVLVSSSIMFIRVGLYAFALNKDLFYNLMIPLGTMAVTGLLLSLWYYTRKWSERADVDIDVKSPFALKPALFFGLFFAFIIGLSKISLHYLPAESLYFVAFFSWFTDVDAITLSVASLTDLSLNTATITIIIAVMVNTAVKWWIAFLFGDRKFAMQVILSIGITMIAGWVSLIFL